MPAVPRPRVRNRLVFPHGHFLVCDHTMDEEGKRLIERIRHPLEQGKVECTSHFEKRLSERGLLWVDVLTIFDDPMLLEDQGLDDHGWPKWRIGGRTADESLARVVIAIRPDERIRFITIHWEK